MKRSVLLLGVLSVFTLSAQESHRSTLQEQSKYYSNYHFSTDAEWDALRAAEPGTANTIARHKVSSPQQICTLNKRVFGWHPYWVGTAYQNYQWNLLSDLCYFSYDTDPATGANTNGSFAWSSSTAVTTAISNGTNVHFCVTLFGSHTSFLGNATAKQTLITNVINLLNSRGGKGVNIDFEGMGASHRAPFTAFMQDLSNQLHAANPSYELSVCLYAVDWSSVFDIAALDSYIDLYTIMGYDYYYGGSSTAGPESPLYNFQTGYNYTLTKSITYYLKEGATPSKVLLGLPWYGREWETTGSTAPSATTGGFTSSRTFQAVKDNTSGNYTAANKHWEGTCFNPYYSYQSGGNWRQCWIDDAYSMRKKFDMVNQRGIGGIGIWALGYDDGYSDYWDAIRDKFSSCATTPCSDTLYDMGGPNRDHYDAENYTFTIQPTGASNVMLSFSQFDLELNYDSLWLYNGLSTAAPLIGAYTGTNSPGTVLSTNGGITLRFKSDNATNNAGYTAIYTCMNDNVAPTTQVAAPGSWITQDFTTTFTDADDASGTGIEKSFYQVLEYNGSEWRANHTRGFFSDNFDTAIHPDWSVFAGNWGINGGYLEQSDETNSNTNIWAPCNQTLSNRYLYNWQGKIDGTGSNRRAGFHFFCDSASTINRHNSYFAWFRADQSVIEIYKVTNDVFSLMSSAPYTFSLNTFYDFTISFDRISGQVQIWVNNSPAASWQDPTPHTIGNYISFRSGNCIYTVNNLKVYRSRYPSVTITVGPGAGNDLRYENTNPSAPAGRIKSIVKDSANNLSAVSSQDVNVDWTAPLVSSSVMDGSSSDLDTTYITNQLQGTYTAATDTNSGVSTYFYAIGTTPGAQDLVAWTNNASALTATETGLSLSYGQQYYFMTKAMNAAGLVSDSLVSDGILVLSPVGINELLSANNIILYPNPAKDQVQLSFVSDKDAVIMYELQDVSGKMLFRREAGVLPGISTLKIDLRSLTLSKGIYFFHIFSEGKSMTKKLVLE